MRVLSVTEAAQEITAAVARQPSLRMPLLDAVGHVLAEDVVAGVALPPWTNAGMDGYAVRADDIRGASAAAPVRLRLSDSIAAGVLPHRPVGPGEAARIFTGAPMTYGADSVVRQEDTERDGGSVNVMRDRDAGANVRSAGGDLQLGALALAAGAVVGPHQVALLAALAVAHPVVHRRPRVGIRTRAAELVALEPPDDILAGRRLADANGPALAALTGEAGGIAVPLGIARDDAADLERLVRTADDVDLLITAGGVSVGDHDHVRAVMRSCGATAIFDRVRVRPGGPTAFSILPGGCPWLALPGNPVSAMVTFELFARPAIRAMAGHRAPLRRTTPALLQRDVQRDATLEQYVRCVFTWPGEGGPPNATPTGPQGSGILTSIARAMGLVIIPPGEGAIRAGSTAAAILFD